MRVNISFPYDGDLLRQTPGQRGQWGGHTFELNGTANRYDAWIVLQSMKTLRNAETRICPPENTVLVVREPPSLLRLPRDYVGQFSTVLSCDRRIDHDGLIHHFGGQTWHFADKSYDDLVRTPPGRSEKLASVITSAKKYTKGHRARLRFVEAIDERFGDRVDIFGHGINPIDDKWDGIYPYRYHIALENSQFADYWTEKISDALLGWSLPIYHGCPNIGDYLPADSFVPIDVHDIGRSLDVIDRCLAEDWAANRMEALVEARDLVLYRHNMFATFARLCDRLPGGEPEPVTVYPHDRFGLFSVRERFLRWIRVLRSRLPW